MLADLDAAEIEGLCDALAADVTAIVSDDELERFVCLILGAGLDPSAGAAIDPAVCQQGVDECVSSVGEGTSTSSCDAEGLMQAAEGCPVTVGEFADCTRASAGQLAELLDALDCAALADPDAADAAFAGVDMEAPECASIAERCPELLETDEPAADGTPPESGCENTCVFDHDGDCDDGGPGMDFAVCVLGTDCADCGPR